MIPFPTGTVLDRFEVVRPLETGGSVRRYLAKHRALGWHCAIELHATARAEVRRALLESLLRGRVRHKHVLAIREVVQVGDDVAIVTEHADGPTLEQHLQAGGTFDAPELVRIFHELCAAVEASHAHGALHLGLCPDAVLLAGQEEGAGPPAVKLMGVGVAAALAASAAEGEPRKVPNPGYAAPELISEGGTADERADVFALGCILYELLTGRGPFAREHHEGSLLATRRGDHPPLGRLVQDAPPNLIIAVERAIAVERSARWSRVSDLDREVTLSLAELEGPFPRAAPPPRPARSSAGEQRGDPPTGSRARVEHVVIPRARAEGAEGNPEGTDPGRRGRQATTPGAQRRETAVAAALARAAALATAARAEGQREARPSATAPHEVPPGSARAALAAALAAAEEDAVSPEELSGRVPTPPRTARPRATGLDELPNPFGTGLRPSPMASAPEEPERSDSGGGRRDPPSRARPRPIRGGDPATGARQSSADARTDADTRGRPTAAPGRPLLSPVGDAPSGAKVAAFNLGGLGGGAMGGGALGGGARGGAALAVSREPSEVGEELSDPVPAPRPRPVSFPATPLPRGAANEPLGTAVDLAGASRPARPAAVVDFSVARPSPPQEAPPAHDPAVVAAALARAAALAKGAAPARAEPRPSAPAPTNPDYTPLHDLGPPDPAPAAPAAVRVELPGAHRPEPARFDAARPEPTPAARFDAARPEPAPSPAAPPRADTAAARPSPVRPDSLPPFVDPPRPANRRRPSPAPDTPEAPTGRYGAPEAPAGRHGESPARSAGQRTRAPTAPGRLGPAPTLVPDAPVGARAGQRTRPPAPPPAAEEGFPHFEEPAPPPAPARTYAAVPSPRALAAAAPVGPVAPPAAVPPWLLGFVGMILVFGISFGTVMGIARAAATAMDGAAEELRTHAPDLSPLFEHPSPSLVTAWAELRGTPSGAKLLEAYRVAPHPKERLAAGQRLFDALRDHIITRTLGARSTAELDAAHTLLDEVDGARKRLDTYDDRIEEAEAAWAGRGSSLAVGLGWVFPENSPDRLALDPFELPTLATVDPPPPPEPTKKGRGRR